MRRLPGPTDAARTGTMPVVNNRKAPKRRAAGGALDRELKRQYSELFSAEMSQRVADREAGVARPMYFLKVNQEREARFAHMAEEAGWYGQRLWRRGWEGTLPPFAASATAPIRPAPSSAWVSSSSRSSAPSTCAAKTRDRLCGATLGVSP